MLSRICSIRPPRVIHTRLVDDIFMGFIWHTAYSLLQKLHKLLFLFVYMGLVKN